MRRLNLYQNIDILQSHNFTPGNIGTVFSAAVNDQHSKYLTRIHEGGTPHGKTVNKIAGEFQKGVRAWFSSCRIDVVVRDGSVGSVMARIPTEYPYITNTQSNQFLEGVLHDIFELEDPELMANIGNRVIEGSRAYNDQNRRTDHYLMEYQAITDALTRELQE
mgnify:CR=1 FL=1